MFQRCQKRRFPSRFANSFETRRKGCICAKAWNYTAAKGGNRLFIPSEALHLQKPIMHRLERMHPLAHSNARLHLAVGARRGKAVVGSDHKLLEAIMRKVCGSTSTSIKHSDVPVEICYCG